MSCCDLPREQKQDAPVKGKSIFPPDWGVMTHVVGCSVFFITSHHAVQIHQSMCQGTLISYCIIILNPANSPLFSLKSVG